MAAAIRTGPLRRKTKPEGCVDSGDEHEETIRRLHAEVRDLPESARHKRLLELGADPLLIAEIDARLMADAETSAWRDGQSPRSGNTSQDTLELHAGDSLGSWRLLKEIGSGGMGAVFLAERSDGHFDQRVAIKLIRGVPDAETFLHFARERQILARLQHPDIARLLDGGATPGGQPYLVMEHIEGIPIERHCAGQQLDLESRLRLFRKVCDAVQFAHQRLIVHCDLKPSNVLVRADGNPVLLDFGIARALDQQPASREARSAGAWITPLYASPEQLRGEPVSTASDVYSLGLILFELLAGRRARVDADDHTITLLGKAEVRPSELAADMPWRSRLRGDLDAIVQRATANDPAQRYESAEALGLDLQRHLEHRPIGARPQTLVYRTNRLVRRRWPAFAAALVMLIGATVFTWKLAQERDRARAAEAAARIEAQTAERASEFLVSVFNVSNPDLNQNRAISARDVLDEGAQRIEKELTDTPAIKARLLAVIGTAYRYIGEPQRAVDMLAKAAALYQDPRVDKPLDAAGVLSQLAIVYSNNEFPASKAEQAARESLRLRELHTAPESAEIADSLNTLGVVLEHADEHDEAERVLLHSLAIRERLFGKDAVVVAGNLNNLGLVERERGNHAQSLAYFERSLQIKRKANGEHNPDYEIGLGNYARALTESGDRLRALELRRQHLALALDLYGADSEKVSSAHNELGSVLHDLGRFNEAAEQYRECMAILARKGRTQSSTYALPLNNLASAYEDMGDYGAAEPLFRESLAVRKATQDVDSPMVARAEYNLGRLLEKRGEYRESETLSAQALASFSKRHDATHRNVVKLILLDVERQLDQHRVEPARQQLAQLAAGDIRWDDRELALRDALNARIAEQDGDLPAALKASQQALAAIRRAWGDHHPLILQYALDLARLQERAGDSDKAKALVASVSDLGSAFHETAPERMELEQWRP